MPEDASSNPAPVNEFFVRRLQCQNNMKLVFRISEDGSEISRSDFIIANINCHSRGRGTIYQAVISSVLARLHE